jgi:hypothetical protein
MVGQEQEQEQEQEPHQAGCRPPTPAQAYTHELAWHPTSSQTQTGCLAPPTARPCIGERSTTRRTLPQSWKPPPPASRARCTAQRRRWLGNCT